MMTALMILAGLSTISTLLIIAGLFMAKRAAGPAFERGEIVLSTPFTADAGQRASGHLAPAFSH